MSRTPRRETIPNEIRRYRKKRHLRIRDVANQLGINQPTHVSQWEKGMKLPTLLNALRVSAALRCPVEVLFCDLFRQLRSEIRAREKEHNIKPLYD